MSKGTILIIDDEEFFRKTFAKMLSWEGYEVLDAEDGHRGIEIMQERTCDVIFCDLKLRDSSGMEVLVQAKEVNPDSAFIVITAYGTIDSAVEAMRKGAYDYISKPLKREEILITVEKSLERRNLLREVRALRQEINPRYSFSNIVGSSQKIREIVGMIRQVADIKSTVLITGESGTGKELVARAIHFNGPRASRPFVVVNCGAIPEHLAESELFGHVKGAFTSAMTSRPGLFEEADAGTLFLDEIGELSLDLQVKLLRAIQEQEIRRVGGSRSIKVDIRFMAATNKDLKEEVAQGRFRRDLFYRIHVVFIHIPPLREHKEDIPLLVRHFLDKYGKQSGRHIHGISPAALDLLMGQPWDGNIRELENAIEQAVAFCTERDILEVEDFSFYCAERDNFLEGAVTSRFSIEEYTRAFILHHQHQYNETELANLLGISPKTLWEKRKRWGLPRSRSA